MDDLLARVDMFKGIPMNGLTALADRGRSRKFPAGTEIMHQGDESDVMHVIIAGKVRVERSHPDLIEPITLAELGPGETVGEMGLLDAEPRSASAIAEADTETLELDAPTMAETIVNHPEVAQALLHILSKRVRSTNELIETAQRRQGRANA